MLHLPIRIVSSIFNPLVPHAPQTVFVWLTSRLKFSDRSFRNAAPSLWNKLPITLRSLFTEATQTNPVAFPPLALSHKQFLKHLKTHLSLYPFLPRLLLSPLPSTSLTSHCPFLLILSSAWEYTRISWFYRHYNLLLSIYYLSIYLPTYLPICLPTYLSIYPIYLSIYPSVRPFVRPSIHLSINYSALCVILLKHLNISPDFDLNVNVTNLDICIHIDILLTIII